MQVSKLPKNLNQVECWWSVNIKKKWGAYFYLIVFSLIIESGSSAEFSANFNRTLWYSLKSHMKWFSATAPINRISLVSRSKAGILFNHYRWQGDRLKLNRWIIKIWKGGEEGGCGLFSLFILLCETVAGLFSNPCWEVWSHHRVDL